MNVTSEAQASLIAGISISKELEGSCTNLLFSR
jgi:hypothetical protein